MVTLLGQCVATVLAQFPFGPDLTVSGPGHDLRNQAGSELIGQHRPNDEVFIHRDLLGLRRLMEVLGEEFWRPAIVGQEDGNRDVTVVVIGHGKVFQIAVRRHERNDAPGIGIVMWNAPKHPDDCGQSREDGDV